MSRPRCPPRSPRAGLPARTSTTCDRLAALPADEFPHTVALAGDLTAPDLDTRFEFALDRLLDGIAALPRS
ncbi:TetR/AcrR family transcriptional regulator C-terminal domain-containing protein [Actinoallomurus rhizosphaericola]|uniref:TetR/AcrR family transcriptional regulator C-terminal domain-containing protein n=1 Tax=Actinoallomurus rhizosphaericola TaxID=2952536 RepID=UPI0020934823|nr:TetR/AcrR family transcriptional regulator C-terminal domain-containing protein [Actinoallomurus rhizosphaericola]MCO5997531.1 TetR/AcrR family transcriptional regulator C-terminal domain-containing protein [Actinoallomurus rhizosphaericola]